MKKFISILSLIIIILLISFTCYAKKYRIKFQWDANTETDLYGYKLYSSNQSMQYDSNNIIDIIIPGTITEYDYTADLSGKTYWVITAFDNQQNESDYSNEVYYDPDLTSPSAPYDFHIFFVYPLTDSKSNNITTIINNTINNN